MNSNTDPVDLGEVLSPCEINAKRGKISYRCRVCHAETNLQWFNDTSCPVCKNPECINELWREWDEMIAAQQEDGT